MYEKSDSKASLGLSATGEQDDSDMIDNDRTEQPTIDVEPIVERDEEHKASQGSIQGDNPPEVGMFEGPQPGMTPAEGE